MSLWTLSSVWYATISLWRTHQNSFLHSILFDFHIFLYAYRRVFPFMNTCIRHLFGFLPRHKHINFKSKWIVHLYIHNKSYKLRALFLPTGFFSSQPIKCQHHIFLFILNTLYTNARASSSARVLKPTKKASQPTLPLTPSQGRSGTGRGEWSVRIRRTFKVDIGCQRC